jgi:hypothetical protein
MGPSGRVSRRRRGGDRRLAGLGLEGTGIYMGMSGTMRSIGNADGSEYDFVFHLKF